MAMTAFKKVVYARPVHEVNCPNCETSNLPPGPLDPVGGVSRWCVKVDEQHLLYSNHDNSMRTGLDLWAICTHFEEPFKLHVPDDVTLISDGKMPPKSMPALFLTEAAATAQTSP